MLSRVARRSLSLRSLSTHSFETHAYPPTGGHAFHLAVPVHDMSLARNFYGNILQCIEGRRNGDKWQDYSLYGHQIVCHFVGNDYRCIDYFNPVDGDEVPVLHFGVCVPKNTFHLLSQRLKEHNIQFIIPPTLRFEGQPGEQHTMFFKDPSGNNLEFKTMTYEENLFARYDVKEG